jgi:hypothetical protein
MVTCCALLSCTALLFRQLHNINTLPSDLILAPDGVLTTS